MGKPEALLVRLNPRVKRRLEKLKQRDGVPMQEQAHRAIEHWCDVREKDKPADLKK